MRRWWLLVAGGAGALVVFLAFGLVLAFFTWQSIQAGASMGDWSYTDLQANADAGRVKTLYIRDVDGEAVTTDGKRYLVRLPRDTTAIAREMAAEDPPVDVRYETTGRAGWLQVLLPNLLLLYLLLAFAAVVGAAVFLGVYLAGLVVTTSRRRGG